MSGATALGILLAHLISDYVLQSDWMATEKTRHGDATLSSVDLGVIRLPAALGLLRDRPSRCAECNFDCALDI